MTKKELPLKYRAIALQKSVDELMIVAVFASNTLQMLTEHLPLEIQSIAEDAINQIRSTARAAKEA